MSNILRLVCEAQPAEDLSLAIEPGSTLLTPLALIIFAPQFMWESYAGFFGKSIWGCVWSPVLDKPQLLQRERTSTRISHGWEFSGIVRHAAPSQNCFLARCPIFLEEDLF
ncbi:uncharacterized protein VTP21DRAFT_2336 [Calcarisporiella thermophila]|uniref:uncharacterized protein n=1 Tax=Calcarisporiella thermophila TaxID=911321 RepID=UPI0037430052